MATIRIRRDTSANWASVNPVLANGELGLDTTTGRLKFGNGSTAWNSLSYSTLKETDLDPYPYYIFYDYDAESYPVETRPDKLIIIWSGPVEPTGLWSGLDIWEERDTSGGTVTAPDPPTDILAEAGNGQATVSWTAPADNGGATITGYRVTPYISGVAQTPVFVGQVLTTVVTELTNGTAYTFRVAAINALGTSSNSDASSAVTPTSPVTVPEAPTNVIASAGNAEVELSWDIPDNGGDPITHYLITPYIGESAQTVINTGNTSNSRTITGLINDTEYTFTVIAVNDQGNSPASTPSNAVTPTAGDTVPSAPLNLNATRGNTIVDLTWEAPASDGGQAITDYVITPYIAGDAQTPINTGNTDLSYQVTGLTNGTAYTFRVAAINSVGTGAQSSPSSAVTPATVPGAPSNVAGTPGDTSVALTWDAPASNGGEAITSYTITPHISGTPQTPITTGSATANYNVTGLTNGTAYTFTVKATNAVGSGSDSTASDAYTPVGVTLSDIAVVQRANGWTQPAGATVVATFDSTPTIGNVMVAVYTGTAVAGVTPPTGWNEHGANTQGTQTLRVFYRVVQSGDGTEYTFTPASNATCEVHLIEFSGVDPTTPFDMTMLSYTGSTVSGNNTISWGPTGTPTKAKAAAIAAIGVNGAITAFNDAWTNDFVKSTGSGQRFVNVAVKIQNSSPSTYSTSEGYTTAASRRPIAVIAVLRPKET